MNISLNAIYRKGLQDNENFSFIKFNPIKYSSSKLAFTLTKLQTLVKKKNIQNHYSKEDSHSACRTKRKKIKR